MAPSLKEKSKNVDRPGKVPRTFRLPVDLEPRLARAAERYDLTRTEIVVSGIEAVLARLEDEER